MGGFDCLGYDQPEEDPPVVALERVFRVNVELPRHVISEQSLGVAPSDVQDCRTAHDENFTSAWDIIDWHGTQSTNSTTTETAALLLETTNGGTIDPRTGVASCPRSESALCTQSTHFQLVSPMSTADLASHSSTTHSPDIPDWASLHTSDVRYPADIETILHDFSLPQGLSPVPTQVREIFTFTISRYERLVETSYFQPAYDQLLRVRQSLSWRLQISPVARWSMFLAAKVFESLVDSPQVRAAKFIKYYDWSKRFEEKINSLPLHGLTATELQNRLGERLEVTLFKLRTTDSINTYQLLRNHASVFRQIVFSDPAFWPNTYYHSTRVSLAHVLASTRYEIAHFALLDMMCSMAYGLPQVIDYDTSIPPLAANFHPVEWIHGCPVDLQIVIVKINSLCNWNQIGPPPDWRPLERELRDWRPDTSKVAEEESWKAVARLAVRENWRHALLIYMYMAVCGVSSDDPRVSSSVKQVFQIIRTVKHKPQPVTNLHFSTQYLIAGAYTPNEKQRAIAREQLSVSVKIGSWLLSGSDLLPVLDHLWHGAAANGRPIRWSDYVCSRQVALPIPI